MIERLNTLPPLLSPLAEGIKIRNISASYPECQVFSQNGGKAFISLLDGDAVIENRGADIEELKSFLGFMAPRSIFSDIDTISALTDKGIQRVNVLMRDSRDTLKSESSDTLKSEQVYEMLIKAGFSLPPYESFAVDFCRRLNRGTLKYFARENQCIAISLIADGYCLLNGIASFKDGMGSRALDAVHALTPEKTMLCCCVDELLNFYIKNGFRVIYTAAYMEEL